MLKELLDDPCLVASRSEWPSMPTSASSPRRAGTHPSASSSARGVDSRRKTQSQRREEEGGAFFDVLWHCRGGASRHQSAGGASLTKVLEQILEELRELRKALEDRSR